MDNITAQRVRLAIRCFMHAERAREIVEQRKRLDLAEAYLREDAEQTERAIRELKWMENGKR